MQLASATISALPIPWRNHLERVKLYPEAAVSRRDSRSHVRCSSAMPRITVSVDLDDRSYPIYIGNSLIDNGALLRKHIRGTTVLVVTNTTVAPLYLDRVVRSLTNGTSLRVEVVILPDGEEYKTMEVLMSVFDKALESRLDRQTTFIALGGGVVGDMTGYAAASYQRGVNFIQIPTTVMAMVDSSVGGKTGVNHPAGKNMIGAFYQPACVLIDIDTLQTLQDREYASGVAEIVKYGLIRDAEFFKWLELNVELLMSRKDSAVMYAIQRSCLNKAEVVALDEKEGGVRATLNLGHTFGHAIEIGIGYGEWLHGEAVAVGLVMAADLSERLGWVDGTVKERICALLRKCCLPVSAPTSMSVDDFQRHMTIDKKAADGKIRFILLKGDLGQCVFTGEFEDTMLLNTLKHFVANSR